MILRTEDEGSSGIWSLIVSLGITRERSGLPTVTRILTSLLTGRTADFAFGDECYLTGDIDILLGLAGRTTED